MKTNVPIILASQSPRRKALLSAMEIPFEVITKAVDESFPPALSPVQAARYIAEQKARAFMDDHAEALVIVADTVVALNDEVLGKPADAAHASSMLTGLSGRAHEVITAVAFVHRQKIYIFHEITEVHFRTLSAAEIDHYIRQYKPFDKAGAYGIQEWIGMIAVEKIVGSYTNVVGLPTERIYRELQQFVCN